jgi:hypothetical protein
MERPLRVAMDALYHLHTARLNRADYHLHTVVAYLVLFRLKEMGCKKLAVLLDGQDTAKMQTLLGFLLDRRSMSEWVKEGWCRFLDRNYVEGTILAELEHHEPELRAWMDGNHFKAFGHTRGLPPSGTAASSTAIPGPPPKRATTVPVAPNLTVPKPRTAPEPERIPQGIKANPVPEWIERTTLAEIEEKNAALRARNHEEMSRKYNFDQTVPQLHETRRTGDKVRAEVEAKRAAEMAPLAPARPPPALPLHGADVKLNAAAIMREDAVLRSKAVKEAAIINDFEGNLRDTTAYYEWREKEMQKDEQARLEAVAARKKEAAVAAASAARARAQQEAAARHVVQDLRAISEMAMEHVKMEKDEEVATRRRVADQVRTVEYIAPARARAEVVAGKRTQHERIREESRRAEALLAETRAKEAAERAEVIRQIRALERVPQITIKTFDPSAPSGVGLLEEMGLVELRERLVLLRKRDEENVEEKRRAILREKREKEELMLARVANIQKLRAQAADINRGRRVDTKQQAAEAAAEAAKKREDAMLDLSEKLAARRAAREEALRQLEEESARREKAAMFLGAATQETEAHRLASRLAGMERQSRTQQEAALRIREAELSVAAVDARQEEVRAAIRRAEERALDESRASAVAAATKEEHAFRLAETSRKKGLFFEATDRSMALLDMRDSLNEYAATRRHGDQDRARTARGGVPIPVQRAETLMRRTARLPEGHPLAATMTMRLTQGAVAASAATANRGIAAGKGR